MMTEDGEIIVSIDNHISFDQLSVEEKEAEIQRILAKKKRLTDFEKLIKENLSIFEQRIAFEKLSPEEKEVKLQKGKEENAKLTEWPPVPNSYLDI